MQRTIDTTAKNCNANYSRFSRFPHGPVVNKFYGPARYFDLPRVVRTCLIWTLTAKKWDTKWELNGESGEKCQKLNSEKSKRCEWLSNLIQSGSNFFTINLDIGSNNFFLLYCVVSLLRDIQLTDLRWEYIPECEISSWWVPSSLGSRCSPLGSREHSWRAPT